MWFNSWEFAWFLPAVLAGYYLLGRRMQNAWLVLASYVFYGWWDWRYLSLIVLSTAVDYFAAQRIHDAEHESRRRLALYASLLVNLGALATFKYFNFFVDSFIELGATIGLNFDTPALRLLPPVGISFYTFQTLSYTIDVYRGKLAPTRSPIDFALYVCYFPQLVAGPIERASRLLPQIAQARRVDSAWITSGLFLILVGLFKKVAIADTAGVRVDDIFAQPDARTSWELWKGMVLFSIQIYGDFSGYSNIARGVSRLFGIELIENFRTPYLASNITDFWRRWHVSLSAWLRDYLYIPLGGNRKGTANTYRNLMLTMLIGGLWHGAAWTFVVWGGLHGIWLALHRLYLRAVQRPVHSQLTGASPLQALRWAAGVFVTFHLVAISWIFFRAENFPQAWAYLTGLVSFRGAFSPGDVAIPVLLLLALAPIEIAQYRRDDIFALRNWRLPVRAACYLGMILGLIFLSGNKVPFIYFQF